MGAAAEETALHEVGPPTEETNIAFAPPDVPAPAGELVTEGAAREVPSDAAPSVAMAAEIAGPASEGAAAAIAEPAMIEVWRPGRAEGRHRPQGRQRRPGKHFARRGAPTQDAAAASVSPAADAPMSSADPTAVAEPSAPGEQQPAGTAKPERHSRHRRRSGSDQRFDRPRRERERPPAHAARHDRHERREKAPDPNSPFAKLAALKAQLEAEAKER